MREHNVYFPIGHLKALDEMWSLPMRFRQSYTGRHMIRPRGAISEGVRPVWYRGFGLLFTLTIISS